MPTGPHQDTQPLETASAGKSELRIGEWTTLGGYQFGGLCHSFAMPDLC